MAKGEVINLPYLSENSLRNGAELRATLSSARKLLRFLSPPCLPLIVVGDSKLFPSVHVTRTNTALCHTSVPLSFPGRPFRVFGVVLLISFCQILGFVCPDVLSKGQGPLALVFSPLPIPAEAAGLLQEIDGHIPAVSEGANLLQGFNLRPDSESASLLSAETQKVRSQEHQNFGLNRKAHSRRLSDSFFSGGRGGIEGGRRSPTLPTEEGRREREQARNLRRVASAQSSVHSAVVDTTASAAGGTGDNCQNATGALSAAPVSSRPLLASFDTGADGGLRAPCRHENETSPALPLFRPRFYTSSSNISHSNHSGTFPDVFTVFPLPPPLPSPPEATVVRVKDQELGMYTPAKREARLSIEADLRWGKERRSADLLSPPAAVGESLESLHYLGFWGGKPIKSSPSKKRDDSGASSHGGWGGGRLRRGKGFRVFGVEDVTEACVHFVQQYREAALSTTTVAGLRPDLTLRAVAVTLAWRAATVDCAPGAPLPGKHTWYVDDWYEGQEPTCEEATASWFSRDQKLRTDELGPQYALPGWPDLSVLPLQPSVASVTAVQGAGKTAAGDRADARGSSAGTGKDRQAPSLPLHHGHFPLLDEGLGGRRSSRRQQGAHAGLAAQPLIAVERRRDPAFLLFARALSDDDGRFIVAEHQEPEGEGSPSRHNIKHRKGKRNMAAGG